MILFLTIFICSKNKGFARSRNELTEENSIFKGNSSNYEIKFQNYTDSDISLEPQHVREVLSKNIVNNKLISSSAFRYEDIKDIFLSQENNENLIETATLDNKQFLNDNINKVLTRLENTTEITLDQSGANLANISFQNDLSSILNKNITAISETEADCSFEETNIYFLLVSGIIASIIISIMAYFLWKLYKNKRTRRYDLTTISFHDVELQ